MCHDMSSEALGVIELGEYVNTVLTLLDCNGLFLCPVEYCAVARCNQGVAFDRLCWSVSCDLGRNRELSVY